MSTLRKLFGFVTLGVLGAVAQQPDPRSSLKVNLPPDSPVTLVTADWGSSTTQPRGGAVMIDLHTSLVLRNAVRQRIRGVTLLVLAQEVTPGGKASVAVPSLDVAPAETFPVRVDLRLLRPLQPGTGPLVSVELDGVLFDDLTFYGPNRLNSRRSMTVWELEARRDRRHFKSVLEARGPEGLQSELVDSLARQAERPRLDVAVARGGRATALAAGTGRDVQFAFLQIPDSPVEPVVGQARVSGNELRATRVEVLNRSNQPVRYFELGWILRDRDGRQYLAGSVPASEALHLAPGQRGQVLEDSLLRFSRQPAQPVAIEGLSAFVRQVEFADGATWIPSRAALHDSRLDGVLGPSPEEQRLTRLYRTKGLRAIIDELKKF